MLRQTGSLETAGTHQNGNFTRKYFSKSARGEKCPKQTCLHQSCLTNYPSILLGNSLQQIWGSQFLYGFPPFYLILHVLKKVSYDQTENLSLVTPTWQSQIWYSLLLEMSIFRPLLLPSNTSLKTHKGKFTL